MVYTFYPPPPQRLEDKCDFTTDATVAVVQKTLQYMEKDLEKKRK